MGLDLVGRVSRAVLALLVPLTLAGGVLAGRPGALGVLAGGLISLASFASSLNRSRAAVAQSQPARTRLLPSGRPPTLTLVGKTFSGFILPESSNAS